MRLPSLAATFLPFLAASAWVQALDAVAVKD